MGTHTSMIKFQKVTTHQFSIESPLCNSHPSWYFRWILRYWNFTRWKRQCWLSVVYLPPANKVCEGYVFTGVCLSTPGGACMVLFGGACMVLFGGVCVVLFGGACMVLFWGHAWFYSGAMHGFIWGHAWFYSGGGHAWFYSGGHAWFYLGGVRGFSGGACVFFSVFSFRIQWDTVNERAVRILLECILVSGTFNHSGLSVQSYRSSWKYRTPDADGGILGKTSLTVKCSFTHTVDVTVFVSDTFDPFNVMCKQHHRTAWKTF